MLSSFRSTGTSERALRILWVGRVEDESSLGTELRNHGHLVQIAEDYGSALIALGRRGFYDVAILANRVARSMRGRGGSNAVRTLRQARPGMLVFIESDDADAHELALRLGADATGDPQAPASSFATAVSNLEDRRLTRLSGPSTSAERRALFVSADPEVETLCRASLEELCDIAVAKDWQSGLITQRELLPQVIVVDQRTEGISVVDFVAAASGFDPFVTTVVLAPLGDLDDAVTAMEQGALDYLLWPTKPDIIVEVVEQAWTQWLIQDGSTRAHRRGPISVLLVENDDADASMIEEQLAVHPTWAVVRVSTLAGALAQVEEGHFDVIVSNLFLPDSQGINTFAALRQRAPDIPKIVLTGHLEDRMAFVAVNSGAQDFIHKGEIAHGLLAPRLEFALARHRHQSNLERFSKQLQRQHATLRDVLSTNADSIVVVDNLGVIRFVNQAATTLLGRDAVHLVGSSFGYPVEPASRQRIHIVHPDRRVVKAEVRARPIEWEGHAAHVVSMRELDPLVNSPSPPLSPDNRMGLLVHDDPLTGLPNRRGLRSTLFAEARRCHRAGIKICAMLVTWENLTAVSRDWSDAESDDAVRAVADVLCRVLRDGDALARIGPDQFLGVLPEARLSEAEVVATRIHEELAASPLIVNGSPVVPEISIGIAPVLPSVSSVQDLVDMAAQRVPQRKKTNELTSAPTQQQALATLAALQLDPNAFTTVAQPIVELDGQTVVALELLSRGPLGPFHRPNRFLGLASEHRMMDQIDHRCLAACVDAAQRIDPSIHIHLNLRPTTALHLSALELAATLRPLEGRCSLEISDREIIGDPGELAAVLDTVRARGFSLVLEDAGFGRRDLESMILLRPDTVKLGKAHVIGIADDPGRLRTMRRLLAVVDRLDCRVIAAGIETPRDLEQVRNLGVRFGQGFLLGRPKPIPGPA